MNLHSSHNVDYSKLQKLLIEGRWQEADYETYIVMLKVVDRKEGDWIRVEEIRNFPTNDLLIIDNLWKKYSHDKFGFSIQKKIYNDICNSFKIEDESLVQTTDLFSNESMEFMRRVGWQVDSYGDLIFNITQAPKGHLPGCWGFRFFGFGWQLLANSAI